MATLVNTGKPLSGICRGGPRNGQLHSTLSGRRTPMEGGAYVYRPSPIGHHVGEWVWLADKEKDGK